MYQVGHCLRKIICLLSVCGTHNKNTVHNFILLHSYLQGGVLIGYLLLRKLWIECKIKATRSYWSPFAALLIIRRPDKKKTPGIFSWRGHVTNRTRKYVLIPSFLILTQDNSKRTQHLSMRTKKWRCTWQRRNDSCKQNFICPRRIKFMSSFCMNLNNQTLYCPTNAQ